jgi:predicted Rossmann fold nucleotide-binding protein DprA/Smf involved in DNA uptake
VPGPVTSSLSVGVNGLIKNGAVVASEPDDILAHYNLLIKQNKFRPDLSLEQKELLLFIPPQGASLNQILSESGKALTQVLKTIDELMEAGYINKAGLGIYYLN